MAPVIEFYIPTGFHKRVKWIPLAQRGKVVEFPAEDPEDGVDIPILSMPAPVPWPVNGPDIIAGLACQKPRNWNR